MSLISFISEFPDEQSCKNKFKEYRDQAGVVCAKCNGTQHYWKKIKNSMNVKNVKLEQL